MTLRQSLFEHYILQPLVDVKSIELNGCEVAHTDSALDVELKPGDVVAVHLLHPPINPDGSPASDRRAWTISE